jgi:Alpha/beta hydrolase domain containing 18
MGNTATKLFAFALERLYLFWKSAKGCHVHLSPDLFDGRAYTIEEFYAECSQYFDRPCEFFRDFQSPFPFELRDRPTGRLKNLGARLMAFESPVPTDWPENNLVPFKWFTACERSKVILLFAPGWGRIDQGFEERLCARLRDQGIDTGLLTKPFHQARTPKDLYSGELFISSNILQTVANFRQFTAEIRLLIQHMRKHYDRVGLIGLSSGGFQTGLASNCEEIDFYFPIATGCQLGSITWHGLLTRFIRCELEQRGITEQRLNLAWSITDQKVLGKHCKARYRKQYVSLYDRVIPLEFQELLWDVYGKPDRMDLRASHISAYFLFSAVFDDISRFVRRCIGR